MSGSGDVYVADSDNNRVAEFSQAGVFVRAFGRTWAAAAGWCARARAWRVAAGGGAGQLDGPRGVAVSGSGDVYVTDRTTLG